MNIDHIATGRKENLFIEDVESSTQLREMISGSRILVIGGAGSIGSSTVKSLIPFQPKSIHVIDQNENQLAELTRDLRNCQLSVDDFHTLPIDFGSPIMQRYLNESKPFDYVLNFAAIKHVRSEKDVYSTLQMLDTNVIKPLRLLGWIEKHSKRYFSVSTDKAANPVNLMGASKSLMEKLIFSVRGPEVCTSARFANVAFSNGSLLESFTKRLEKRQPLAVPADTRRFFVSQEEAGSICLLATFVASHRQIFIPKVNENIKLIDLKSVAEAFLKFHGYRPLICHSEEEALAISTQSKTEYPLLVTALNTAGEKPYEEFLAEDETEIDVGLKHIAAIDFRCETSKKFAEVLGSFEQMIAGQRSTDDILGQIEAVVPELVHIKSEHQLDQRM